MVLAKSKSAERVVIFASASKVVTDIFTSAVKRSLNATMSSFEIKHAGSGTLKQ